MARRVCYTLYALSLCYHRNSAEVKRGRNCTCARRRGSVETQVGPRVTSLKMSDPDKS